jgi:oligopeptide/dipeptide ABC transporter ATP-binding protein
MSTLGPWLAEMDTSLLELDRLSVEISTDGGSFRPVDEVSFLIGRGEIVGLVGESGSGKTMTALSILGLLPRRARVLSGEIRLEGTDLSNASEAQLRRVRGRRVGYVAQDATAALDPVLRIETQITETLRAHLNLPRKALRPKAEQLLKSVGIPEADARLRAYPHELSGGMRQRVTIAIALACDPELVIADEPTTALDVTVQAQIIDLLLRAAQSRGASILLISHDLRLIATVSDRILVMYAGRIVEAGTTSEVIRAPEHPYTAALLDSTPRVGTRSSKRLKAIAGRPPDFLTMPSGCRFHPRCPYADNRCVEHEPRIEELGRAACWYPSSSRATAVPEVRANG